MNINRENKIIWWAPERCATKLTAEIFKKLGFEVFDKEKQDFVSLSEHYHSHDIVFPEEFKDYKLICNIRNPYDRVLSFYLNFTSVGKNYVYTKHKKDDFKKREEVAAQEAAEQTAKEVSEAVNNKVQTMYNMIIPLLQNLAKDADTRDYIYWPKRKEKINSFIKKLDQIVKSN